MQEKAYLKGRTPSQPRAQRTISDLFEATAQLLDGGPAERLTTNHVAARAGYSIGTLYRYFPSKRALLQAMVLQETSRQEAKVQAAINGVLPTPGPEPIVRICIRAVLHPFAGRNRVHAGIMQLLATAPAPNATLHVQTNVVPPRANDALPPTLLAVLSKLSDATAFTMIHAVTGAIEAALRSNSELIGSREFEDQLVSLVLHFLDADKL